MYTRSKHVRTVHTSTLELLAQVASERFDDIAEEATINSLNELVNGGYPRRTSLLPFGNYADNDVQLYCFLKREDEQNLLYDFRCYFKDNELESLTNISNKVHRDPEVSGIKYHFSSCRIEGRGALQVETLQRFGPGCMILSRPLSYELLPKLVDVIKQAGCFFHSQNLRNVLPLIRSFVLDDGVTREWKINNLSLSLVANFANNEEQERKIARAVRAIVDSTRFYSEDLHICGFYIGFSVSFFVNPELLASYVEMMNLFNPDLLPYAGVLRAVYVSIGTRWGHLFFQEPGVYTSPFRFVTPNIMSRAISFVRRLNVSDA